MPELPDIEGYLEALRPRLVGRALESVRVAGLSLLRTFEPPVEALVGREVTGLSRVGKRIVIRFSEAGATPSDATDLFAVIHLMIAGRLQWKPPGSRGAGRITQATLGFSTGTLVLTEAGTKHRATMHVLQGLHGVRAHDPGGIEPLADSTTPESLLVALSTRNRTLKRALTDPATLSGIGNAFSDEVLHAAGLSPILLTGRLTLKDADRLHSALRSVLGRWKAELSGRFVRRFPGPGDVTAFRPEFAAHGRFGQPCPACGTNIQRIVRAENEVNYCPRCQTGGRVLADRSLSRLLKDDWPATIEEWEGQPRR